MMNARIVLSLTAASLIFLRPAVAATDVIFSTSTSQTSQVVADADAAGHVVGQAIVLDGTRSQDDGSVGKFRWRQTDGPMVTLSDASSLAPSFTPSVPGTYAFELVVTDASGLASTARSEKFVVGNGATVAAIETDSRAGAATTARPSKGGTAGAGSAPAAGKDEAPTAPPLEVAPEPSAITPDFGILLGRGDAESNGESRAEVARILLQGAMEEGVPVKDVKLDSEKVIAKVVHPVKLLGIIPVSIKVVVEIDLLENVNVRFPWWSFVMTGKDMEGLGARVYAAVSNVLKTKHDTIKDAIGNAR